MVFPLVYPSTLGRKTLYELASLVHCYIAENINLFVVTIGKVCHQQAGWLAGTPAGGQDGREAGVRCNNAKCQVCVCTTNVDEGGEGEDREPRKK